MDFSLHLGHRGSEKSAWHASATRMCRCRKRWLCGMYRALQCMPKRSTVGREPTGVFAYARDGFDRVFGYFASVAPFEASGGLADLGGVAA